jgi:hypothetical protein
LLFLLAGPLGGCSGAPAKLTLPHGVPVVGEPPLAPKFAEVLLANSDNGRVVRVRRYSTVQVTLAWSGVVGWRPARFVATGGRPSATDGAPAVDVLGTYPPGEHPGISVADGFTVVQASVPELGSGTLTVRPDCAGAVTRTCAVQPWQVRVVVLPAPFPKDFLARTTPVAYTIRREALNQQFVVKVGDYVRLRLPGGRDGWQKPFFRPKGLLELSGAVSRGDGPLDALLRATRPGRVSVTIFHRCSGTGCSVGGWLYSILVTD